MATNTSLIRGSYRLVWHHCQDIICLAVSMITLGALLATLAGMTIHWGIFARVGIEAANEPFFAPLRALVIFGPLAVILLVVPFLSFSLLRNLLQVVSYLILTRSATEPFFCKIKRLSVADLVVLMRLLVVDLLSTLGILLGLLLLLVPGLYLKGRLQLAPLVCMEARLGIIPSLRRSWQLTAGHVGVIWLNYLGVHLTGILLLSLGYLCLNISLAWMAWYVLLIAFDIQLYRQLLAAPQEKTIVQ